MLLIKAFIILIIQAFLIVDGLGPKSRVTFFRNKVFTFHADGLYTNDEAKAICEKYGGNLCMLKDAPTHMFVEGVLKEYMMKEASIYDNGFFIGLHQVGKDNSKWRWSDGEEMWFNNFIFKEPNDPSQTCVFVSVSTKKISGIMSFGFWADHFCDTKLRFICQNDFGSSFVTEKAINVEGDEEQVDCTIVGDAKYSVNWKKNGVLVSGLSEERLYQKYKVKDSMRTSTIVFVDPLKSDGGVYICVAEYEKSTHLEKHQLTVNIKKEAVVVEEKEPGKGLSIVVYIALGSILLCLVICFIHYICFSK